MVPRFSRLAAAGIAGGVLAASALVGRRNAPDPSHPRTRAWYKRLRKPGFTPPDPVFAAVWPVLEAGLAAGGYRLLRANPSPDRTRALALWFASSAGVGGWTELFFRRHALGASTGAAAAMVATGAAYGVSAARVDRVAAATAVPFVAWLGFATLLAERVRERNSA